MVMDPSGRLRRIEEGEAIYYDTANGVAGQTYPIGTRQMPAQNWADLAAIVTQRGINTVRLLSDITIGGAITDWNIIGDVGRTVTLNGQVLTACYFELCVLTGNLGAASSIYALNCLIGASTVMEIRAFNCEVDGVQIFTANPSYLYQCYGRGVTLDMTNDPTVYVYGGKGDWTVANLTAGGIANIYLDAGVVTLAASCTGGTVNIYGTCQVVDNSAGSTVNDNSLMASMERQLFTMDFWSDPAEEVQIGDAVAGATVALTTVTVADLPAGATIVRAIAMFKFRMIENTNAAANKLNGATVAGTSQVIQVRDDTPGTWRDAINFVDDQFGIAATTREGGDILIGSIDIAVEVDGNDGYNFQWLLGRADLDYLNFNDVQTGLRIWYSV